MLEIGTFLGGTTRAIALGMLDNPSLDKTRKLVCCDRFDTYYSAEELHSFMKPLVENGMLEQNSLAAFSGTTSFRDLFDLIHSSQPYSALLNVNEAELPMLPDSSPPSRPLNIDKDRILGSVFIDGCKSWYALKYFMCTALPRSRTGSYYLFQDYGMYTCFWIPVFLELFSDHFKLVAYLDGTYIFRMLSDPGRGTIHSEFPDTPQQLGWDRAEALFSAICNAAQKRGDEYGYTVGLLQKAGYAAYCGELVIARNIIDAMKDDKRFGEYSSLIESARRIPAYKPVSNGQRGDDPHWLGGQPIYL